MKTKRHIKRITICNCPISDFWIRIFLIQLCVFTPSLFAGWFFGDNYYEISYKFSSGGYTQKAIAIGEPWSEGPFTVYTSYPDKKKVKIKTEHILKIVDTGTKKPFDPDAFLAEEEATSKATPSPSPRKGFFDDLLK